MLEARTKAFIARSEFGRFAAECDAAAVETVRATVEAGAAIARSLATHKTGAMAGSIEEHVEGTRGWWSVGTDHWLYQEEGTGPHDIDAHVSFFWEKVGRRWMHPEVYQRITGHPGADPINHPGNPAVHFMQKSFEIVGPQMIHWAEEFYP